MALQLRLFEKLEGLDRPKNCPDCGARLRLTHETFYFVHGNKNRGCYEMFCVNCRQRWDLWGERDGAGRWELVKWKRP
jgi:hypothetical protein